MPAITLRLTDEQHEVVRGWAFVNKRSIQRELEARLFADGVLVERGAPSSPRGMADADAVEASRSTSTPKVRTKMCEHRVPAGSFCKTCDSA